jgi:tetratricopeptide (TPR) repeat protein
MLALLMASLIADAASMMAAGDKASAERDFRTALFAYQDATREDPSSAVLLVKLGQTYARMGHDPEAIESFSRALRLDTKNAAAAHGISASRERLATLAPPKPQRQPEPEPQPQSEPEPVLDEAGARERYTAAVKLINDRQYAEAVPVLDEALRKKPGYGVALVARGSAHMGLLQYEAAAADYSAARASDPSLASPLFGLAEAYRALGQPARAAHFYKEYAASSAPDVQAQLKDYADQNARALANP